ncbi:ComEC family competence protein, partial [Haemophilus influenzae]
NPFYSSLFSFSFWCFICFNLCVFGWF